MITLWYWLCLDRHLTMTNAISWTSPFWIGEPYIILLKLLKILLAQLATLRNLHFRVN